ncbi:MAG TPA: hypothetical protein VG097_10965, partial [Gemmata sp.]|nr:hypothetical protein [Gemmata sp.]
TGFILLTGTLLAQDPMPTKNSEAVSEVSARLSKEARGIPPEDLPLVKKQFQVFAKYYGDLISNPTFYKASIDPKFGSPPAFPPIMERSAQNPSILSDMDRYILRPNPTNSKLVNVDKIEYIRELGIAFDAVLKPLIESHSERIVRINAARLLAEVCRSGAAAHWPTVTSLLSNANTAAEIKNYALLAAGNLLSAYDVKEYRFRTPSNGPKEVGALAQAIMTCIENPSHLLPGFKAEEATPDQRAVVQYLRKQAVKALGQVRFVAIPGPDGKQKIYPAYTLAQICVSDPKIFPEPTPAECGEAVIGLCNMSRSMNNNIEKGFNTAGVVEAMASGLITFATPRTEPLDRSLPWRNYSFRLAEAMKNWRPLWDPVADATQPENFDAGAVPPMVNDFIARVQTLILAPIDKVDINAKPDPNSAVNIEGLKDYRNELRDNSKRSPLLFTDIPDSVIYNPTKK